MGTSLTAALIHRVNVTFTDGGNEAEFQLQQQFFFRPDMSTYALTILHCTEHTPCSTDTRLPCCILSQK